MNPAAKAFIHKVLEEVHYKKVHTSLAEELNDHIESLKESYKEEGLGEEEAYKKAIEQMGEASDIGKNLHHIHKPKMEWSILLLTFAILGIGLLALWAYCAVSGEGAYYFTNQLGLLCLGGIVFVGAYFLPYQKLEKWAMGMYLLGIGLLMYLYLFGIGVNGSIRWVAIGPITFDVTRFTLPLFILAFIGLIKQHGKDQMMGYWKIGGLAFIPIMLLGSVSFLSSLLLGVCLVMLLTYHIVHSNGKMQRLKLLATLYGVVGSGIIGIGLALMSQPYRVERLKVFFNPDLDPSGMGYMAVQMRAIQEASAWLGDAGFSTIPVGYLPGPATDVILTFIVGSMGWLVGLILISFIGLILVRLLKATFKVRDYYGRLVALSVVIFFAVQFVYNIAMNLGWVPIIGIGLPFVSYGGTQLITNMAMMGLFLSVYRRKDIVQLEQA